jgi:hypothetical protein
MFENIREEDMLNYYLHKSVFSDVSYQEYRNQVIEKSIVVEVNEDEVFDFASQYIEERGD